MSFKIPCGGFKLDEKLFSLDKNDVLSIPKPLTYDYMPEGYPTKSVQTTTLMEEQEVAFINEGGRAYAGQLTDALEIVVGQTYTVNWDGAEYKCVCVAISSHPVIGNLSIMGMGDDTGEPFVCVPFEYLIATLDTSASHTVGITTIMGIATTMAEEFLPTIPADKLPTIPADKLPTIPADKLPTIPVIEFTTDIQFNIKNDASPSFAVSNLSYSEIYSIVEKGSFKIKDSLGLYYSPIRCSIDSSGNICIGILVIDTPMTYANLLCNANQTIFYRDSWWQIEATKK